MSKLEAIDYKRTNYGGLWWHPEYNAYSSQALSLAELRKFKGSVRLIVRKNKYFNNGQNSRPNYQFCLVDAKSDKDFLLDVQKESKFMTGRQFMIQMLQMAKEDVENMTCWGKTDREYYGYWRCRRDIIDYMDKMIKDMEEEEKHET